MNIEIIKQKSNYLLTQVRIVIRKLFYQVHTEASEVLVVGAVWWDLIHHIWFISQHIVKGLDYETVLSKMFSSNDITLFLTVLAMIGLAGILSGSERLRKFMLLCLLFYFATTGFIIQYLHPELAIGGYHMFIMSPTSLWAFWRIGEDAKDDRLKLG